MITPNSNFVPDAVVARWRELLAETQPIASTEALDALVDTMLDVLLVAFDDGYAAGFEAADESRLNCEEGA